MNIEGAINEVAKLKKKIKDIDAAIEKSKTATFGRKPRVVVSVFVEGAGDNNVLLCQEDAIALLQATRNKMQREVEKLQPVIDMANAALKGIMQ